MLSQLYPPLHKYWPNLNRVSAPQTAFLVLDNLEAIYGGAAGGGKSDALLAAALQYVDIPGYAALILRRTFKQLSLPGAIMARSKEWLKPHREVHWNDDDKTWTFPSGATLTFGFLEHADDIYRYQGPEFQYIGFDELTQFHEAQYTYLFSRLRRRTDLHVPVRARSASNPGGVGHAWVKARFPIAPDQTPRMADGRIFVPAKVTDNPGLDPDEYALALAELGDVLRAQLMNGDWGAFEGAAYPGFDEALHVVHPFDPPETWERFEHMDFGTSNPTAWYVTAVDYDGNLIVLDGFYKDGHEVANLPSTLAPQIKQRRLEAWEARDGRGVQIPNPVWGDPAVWGKSGTTNKWGRPASVGDEFADEGIQLSRANNDRVAGYVRLAGMIAADERKPFPAWHPRAGEKGSPGLFIFDTPGTVELRQQIAAAPLEELGEPHPGEAVSRRWEGPYGHAHAALRYGVMSRPGPSEQPKEIPDDPRAALMQRVEEKWAEDNDTEWGGSRRYTTV